MFFSLVTNDLFARNFSFKQEPTLIVVPARMQPIKMAVNLAALRPVHVISCGVVDGKPLLHLWTGASWRYLSLADFEDGAFLTTDVAQAFLIGDEQTLSPEIARLMFWCPNVTRLETLQTAELLNTLDKTYKFGKSEWQWLAGRHGLGLKDVNAKKRSINPYDTPRSQLPVEQREYRQGKGDLPPAELIIETQMPEPSQPDED